MAIANSGLIVERIFKTKMTIKNDLENGYGFIRATVNGDPCAGVISVNRGVVRCTVFARPGLDGSIKIKNLLKSAWLERKDRIEPSVYCANTEIDDLLRLFPKDKMFLHIPESEQKKAVKLGALATYDKDHFRIERCHVNAEKLAEFDVNKLWEKTNWINVPTTHLSAGALLWATELAATHPELRHQFVADKSNKCVTSVNHLDVEKIGSLMRHGFINIEVKEVHGSMRWIATSIRDDGSAHTHEEVERANYKGGAALANAVGRCYVGARVGPDVNIPSILFRGQFNERSPYSLFPEDLVKLR